MRDVLITLIVVAALPLAVMRPWTGVLAWSWISYMNPHRMAWGFAYHLPFAQLIGVATLIGALFHRGPKSLPRGWVMWVWIALIGWMCLTTLFALDAAAARPQWERVMKIQLFSMITLMLIRDRRQIEALVWITVASLGFFGLKGGLFALRVGGSARVWGPPDSIIADNNALAVALLMTIPLMRYLQMTTANKYLRWGLVATMIASGLSILSSQSRGALIASCAMLLYLIAKSRHRMRLILACILLVPAALMFMPQSWYDRMQTLGTYQEDKSAMGRITAWEFAIDMSSERLTGGGFESFNESNYKRFSPQIAAEVMRRDGRYQGAHSIYFQILGDHGMPGVLLFLLFLFGGMRMAARVAKTAAARPDMQWAADLGRMIQVSLISFAVGGAFLELAYFDFFFQLVGMSLMMHRLLSSAPQATAASASARSASALPAGPQTGPAGAKPGATALRRR